jgi:hypothetical protein
MPFVLFATLVVLTVVVISSCCTCWYGAGCEGTVSRPDV